MCGVAGVLASDGGVRAAAPALESMRRGVRHRGPDDEGVWLSDDGVAGFVHTRLAILDLTSAGHQPMQSENQRFTITFNGEIYNFHELRRSLEQRGARFRTRTDTEVILRAFELDGPECIRTLRGMFAFAIWDARERSCVLARDRFGIKPLYFHNDGGRLTFASEVKALIQSRAIEPSLDPEGLFGYFLNGTVPEPFTLLRNVRCLEPGTYAVWKNGELSAHRYWTLNFSGETPHVKAVDEARRALVDSVAHHFVSDAPVGIFLSGGVDSTALLALARAAGQRDIHTFSLSFPGHANNEGVIAAQTALHFGTDHAEWAIDADTGRTLFRGFLDASDQPSIDGLNTYSVSKFARERGMKVVLSGLGGDELFGGYPSFEQVPRLHAWNSGLSMLGPVRSAIGRQLERQHDGRMRRLGDLLQRRPTLANAYQAFRGVFTHAESRALVERYTGATVMNIDECPSPMHNDPTLRDAVSRLELRRYMRNQPLRDGDTMSMAWGLELRVPFLDGPLVDTLAKIPAAIRLQPAKRFLLQTVPEMPAWVVAQPKRGFMFPFQDWLADDWRDMFVEIERDCPVPTQSWYRKWCLYVFTQWAEKLRRSRHE